MLKYYHFRDYNYRLVIWVAVLSVLSVFLVGSAEASLQTKQLLGIAAGICIMFFVSLIDYSWILNFYWVIYAFNLLLLGLVPVFGKTVGGARRWLQIGSSFRFQPVELTKILLICFFAKFFYKHQKKINKPYVFFGSLGLLAVPLFFVFRQPDLKNTLTLLIVFAFLYFSAGLSWKVVGGFLGTAVVGAVILFGLVGNPDIDLPIKEYQRNRIMAFLHPDDEKYAGLDIQQNNSVIAIGSGQLYGKGLNNDDADSANKGDYIAEIQTDFIFAVAGEEMGFLGSAGIIVLLFLVIAECLFVSVKAKDLSGKILCSGMASVIFLQSFINIAVATRILPNTGTPLPFISYGLTSIWSLFIGIGMVLNVSLQGKIEIPSSKKARKTGRKRSDSDE